MNSHYSDASMAKLRSVVAQIEDQVSHVPPTAALSASITELIGILDLGPAPELRECPHCRGEIMRQATRCVHCWSKFKALPRLGAAA